MPALLCHGCFADIVNRAGTIFGNKTGDTKTPLGLIASAAAVAFLQVTDDLGHNLERLAADIDGDRMLIRCRLLQGGELAIEEGDRHEVLVPRG